MALLSSKESALAFEIKLEQSSELYREAALEILTAVPVGSASSPAQTPRPRIVRPHISSICCPSTKDELALYTWTRNLPPTKTLLLIHGWNESMHRYDGLATYFLNTFTSVIGVDNAFHGRSAGYDRANHEVPATFGLQERWAQNLADVVLKARPDCVFAHSMGGLALYFALPLVAARFHLENEATPEEPLLKNAPRTAPSWSPADLRVVLSAPCFAIADPVAAPLHCCSGYFAKFVLYSLRSYCYCLHKVAARPTPAQFRASLPDLSPKPQAIQAADADPLFGRTNFLLNVFDMVRRTGEAQGGFARFRGCGSTAVLLGPPVRGATTQQGQKIQKILVLHPGDDKVCAVEASEKFARENSLVQFVRLPKGLGHEWFRTEAGALELWRVMEFFRGEPEEPGRQEQLSGWDDESRPKRKLT